MLDTIRSIITERDGLSSFAIDALFTDATDDIADGVDPEDALLDTFGLEPDYLFDAEFLDAAETGFARRA